MGLLIDACIGESLAALLISFPRDRICLSRPIRVTESERVLYGTLILSVLAVCSDALWAS